MKTEDRVGNTSEVVTPSVLTHQVVSGDTLSQIAKHYNTTVKGIKAVNRMTDDVIYVGQLLKLPIMASTTVNLGMSTLEIQVASLTKFYKQNIR